MTIRSHLCFLDWGTRAAGGLLAAAAWALWADAFHRFGEWCGLV
ncbi:hypothetical protein [Polaromonas sp.]|nr:hypothetical protein [Polaromonas sp.]